MASFERKLKVDSTDGYELNIISWLEGETVTSFTVVDDSGLTTVNSSSESGGLISVSLTGLTVGAAQIHFEYSTATRSDCYKARLNVIEGC